MTDNENTAGRPRRVLIAVVLGAALVIALVVAIVYAAGSDPSTENSDHQTAEPTAPDPSSSGGEGEDDVEGPTSFNTEVLPSPMNGQEAIDELGDNIEIVAQRNGKTVEELKELLLRDETAYVSTRGYIFYRDSSPGD